MESSFELRSFVASDGWATKFLERTDLVLRRATACEKSPSDFAEKLINFLSCVRYLREMHQLFDFA